MRLILSMLFLAFRAVKSRAACLGNLLDFRLTYRAGLACFAVNVETVLEFADSAVGAAVIAQSGAAGGDGVLKDGADVFN